MKQDAMTSGKTVVFTAHAIRQMQNRGVHEGIVGLVARYGSRRNDERGHGKNDFGKDRGFYRFIERREASRIMRDGKVSAAQIERVNGIIVATCEYEDYILVKTVLSRNSKIRRGNSHQNIRKRGYVLKLRQGMGSV